MGAFIGLTDHTTAKLPTPHTPGHPFDTIKTKMQAQEGFLKGPGMVGSFTTVLKTQVRRPSSVRPRSTL